MGDVRNHFIQALKSLLLDVDGDLFSLPMLAYDQFLQRRERGDLMPRRCIQILRINREWICSQPFPKPPFFLPDELFPLIDTAQFRCRDRNFVESAFFLSIMCLISVIMDTFAHTDRAALQRTVLRERIEIVKRGCLLPCQEAPRRRQRGENKYESKRNRSVLAVAMTLSLCVVSVLAAGQTEETPVASETQGIAETAAPDTAPRRNRRRDRPRRRSRPASGETQSSPVGTLSFDDWSTVYSGRAIATCWRWTRP